MSKTIYYSNKYTDDEFEYRHVMLPKHLSKLVSSSHLMTEEEWKGLGVQQSQGWIHYMIHKPGMIEASKESGGQKAPFPGCKQFCYDDGSVRQQ